MIPLYARIMAVILPSWFVAFTYSNAATFVSALILALGLVFAGYFGFRDKSWKTAAAGWREAFENQHSETKKLANRVTELQRALEVEAKKPDLAELVLVVNDANKAAEIRQNQILDLLARVISGANLPPS